MGKKLKFKLTSEDPLSGTKSYQCRLCKDSVDEMFLDYHADEHNRNSYIVDIDIKKGDSDDSSIFKKV